MKYFTQEWVDAVKEKSEDANYLKKAKGFSEKFQWVATSCPGGVDSLLTVELKDGKVLSAKVEEKPSPAEFPPLDSKQYLARVIGLYETWIKVNKRELTAVEAQMGGNFRMEGNVMKLLPMAAKLQAFIDMAGSIPVEY